MSPCSHRFGFKKPIFTTIFLHEMLPGYMFEINLKPLPGATPKRVLTAVWFFSLNEAGV